MNYLRNNFVPSLKNLNEIDSKYVDKNFETIEKVFPIIFLIARKCYMSEIETAFVQEKMKNFDQFISEDKREKILQSLQELQKNIQTTLLKTDDTQNATQEQKDKINAFLNFTDLSQNDSIITIKYTLQQLKQEFKNAKSDISGVTDDKRKSIEDMLRNLITHFNKSSTAGSGQTLNVIENISKEINSVQKPNKLIQWLKNFVEFFKKMFKSNQVEQLTTDQDLNQLLQD